VRAKRTETRRLSATPWHRAQDSACALSCPPSQQLSREWCSNSNNSNSSNNIESVSALLPSSPSRPELPKRLLISNCKWHTRRLCAASLRAQRLNFLRSHASTIFFGSIASRSTCSSRIFPSFPIRKLTRRAALYLST